jgi:DNA polymerase-1
VRVYSTHQEGIVYDTNRVRERFKVEPERIPDIMSLMGDASDNIPGVKGIGEKTAVELIAEFGSLENLLKHSDRIKSEARKKTLRENEALALLSKELAIVDRDVPIELDLGELELKEPDRERLVELFKELEFKSLLKEVAPQDELKSKYALVADEKAFMALVGTLRDAGEFTFDSETTSEDPVRAELVGISFSFKKGEAWYVGVEAKPGSGDSKKLERDFVLGKLAPIFENAHIKKTGQNIKYEYIVLANYGIHLAGIAFDTMVASYLLNPSKLNHNLEDISLDYLSHKMTTPITDLIGKGKGAITMDKVDVEKVCAYSCEDSDVTYRLKDVLQKEISKKGLDNLFHEVEMPLIEVLATMEISGVSIDVSYLRELSKEMERKLERLTRNIYELAGEEFNINSPKQLSRILFDKLKLPVLKKTKTGVSTDEDVLTKLAPKHKLPEALLEYREFSKLKSTYVDALPTMVNEKTGRLHTSFNQTVTATGRLSSSDPNLQNIPIKTEEGRKIRKAFIPYAKGDRILSADYSQIELRLLAHLSGDRVLAKAFKEGFDIHAYTASLIFGVDEKDVTPEMRGMAKTVNFGIIYGMSPYGLSQNLNIEVDKAKEFIDSYFDRYPDVKSYLEGVVEEARKCGFVTTILGRRRYIPEISSEDVRLKGFAERTAINAPVQGSAADVIKVAMIAIHDELRRRDLKSKMILQVHDELVFNVARGEMAEICKIVKDKMEHIIKLKVPIEAHVEAGENWLELERIRGDG